jgi:NAD(P)-dependent dehydrogenase (short-subunit alcohol dehydrogenase family)
VLTDGLVDIIQPDPPCRRFITEMVKQFRIAAMATRKPMTWRWRCIAAAGAGVVRSRLAACLQLDRGLRQCGDPGTKPGHRGITNDPLETSDDEWRRCLAINLEGAWACSRAVLPGMIAKGHGVIVNIASTHSFTIIPGTFPYPVAKHALMGLTKSLGLEYAGKGIRVNAIAPGYVATQKVIDWWNSAPDREAARQATYALHPQHRIATPEEIARAAVFMISDECPFMTAACLTIDGGLSVRQHD